MQLNEEMQVFVCSEQSDNEYIVHLQLQERESISPR